MAASPLPVYDRIGAQYRRGRREDPRIAAPIQAALEDASPVVNVGGGSGSYEPRDRPVVAAEPSTVMLSQRPAGGMAVEVAFFTSPLTEFSGLARAEESQDIS